MEIRFATARLRMSGPGGGTLIGTNGKRCMCSRSNRVSGPVSILPEGQACASQQEKSRGILRIRCFVRLVT
jgi:hypothetical protein